MKYFCENIMEGLDDEIWPLEVEQGMVVIEDGDHEMQHVGPLPLS